MAKYKTALGRTVDMAALAAKNERVRAVGNMKVNARGDTIDSMGNIIKSVNSKVNSGYAKTVGNRSAQAKNKQVAPSPMPAKADPVIEEFKPISETTQEEDDAIEAIKAKEVAKESTSTKPAGKKNDQQTKQS
jgi:hypothetical protein